MLVLISTGVGMKEIAYVFPASSTDHLTLHTGRIGILRIPANIGVYVVLEVVRTFIIEGRGPFCYVTSHAIEAEIIRPVGIGAHRIESAVFRVITTSGFEVSEQAAFFISQVIVTPGEHRLGASAS